VLAWLVRGAVLWYQSDRLMAAPPPSVVSATQKWRKSADLLLRYMDDNLVFDCNAHVMAKELFEDFAAWLKANGHMFADEYCASASWADILVPHGWQCRDHSGDADGSRWLHPRATSPCSATVRHGCLFVWSTNTPFEVSEPSNPRGYTRFRALSVLNHSGDMSAAARALAKGTGR
jgi:hypothetical protein